jgi:hypothetical protein
MVASRAFHEIFGYEYELEIESSRHVSYEILYQVIFNFTQESVTSCRAQHIELPLVRDATLIEHLKVGNPWVSLSLKPVKSSQVYT